MRPGRWLHTSSRSQSFWMLLPHQIARAMTPFVRFLNPVIDPVIYLWEGSSCAFPGAKPTSSRHAGLFTALSSFSIQ